MIFKKKSLNILLRCGLSILLYFIINNNAYAYKVNCTSTNTNNTSYAKYYGANWDYWADGALYGGDEMYTWISNDSFSQL